MKIHLNNIGVRFPIYDAKQRSFKTKVLAAASGGHIIRKPAEVTVVEAIKDLTLQINQGDRVALLGHNGSGKTTLLRVMAGVYEPEQGSVEVVGRVTSLLDPTLGMDLDATGYENIRLKTLFIGLGVKLIDDVIAEVADFSGLGDFLSVPVRTYSSGMILRLAFAISTCIEPEILLMDEWLSVGDEAFRAKAEKRLNDFIDRAGILVIATHDLGIASRLGCQTIKLEHGRLLSN